MNNSAILHPFKLGTIYILGTNKKVLSGIDNAHLVEHLEKSSPLITEKMTRLHDLLWDDWIDY
jgi:hypothetical protein